MYQLGDNVEKRNEYAVHLNVILQRIKKNLESQDGTEALRKKLENLKWNNILDYKNKILKMDSIPVDIKLLIRLYTEIDCPVRNDFGKIRVFIDEPRPIDYDGNCIMLTKTPLIVRKKKFIIKKSGSIDTNVCTDDAVIYPVRNMIWLTKFKTSKCKSVSDIIQSVPTKLANDIIKYCEDNKTRELFNYPGHAISKKIHHAFEIVSGRKIGINVMRHLYIMYINKDAPMLDVKSKTAAKMGHSVNMQELYRVKV